MNLRYLDLSSNGITGPNPLGMSTLTNLQNMFLQDNLLNGTISTEIAALTSLR